MVGDGAEMAVVIERGFNGVRLVPGLSCSLRQAFSAPQPDLRRSEGGVASVAEIGDVAIFGQHLQH